jgi:hypothetical protein
MRGEAAVRGPASAIAFVTRGCAVGLVVCLVFASGCSSSSSPAAAVAPPTISGAPAATVTAGQAYSFTPTAASPRGAGLSFTITGSPSWATFSATTGQLAGTPSTSDDGIYSNISITVSDGTASASLGPFTITVEGEATGSAQLTWTVPALRTDGTPLTNLAGFRIYYGTALGSYPSMVAIPDPTATQYTVTGLATGTTYYFVATVYDSAGVESAYTNPVSKPIT